LKTREDVQPKNVPRRNGNVPGQLRHATKLKSDLECLFKVKKDEISTIFPPALSHEASYPTNQDQASSRQLTNPDILRNDVAFGRYPLLPNGISHKDDDDDGNDANDIVDDDDHDEMGGDKRMNAALGLISLGSAGSLPEKDALPKFITTTKRPADCLIDDDISEGI